MYRKGSEYDRIAKLAIDLYLDYGFVTFPLNEEDVCQKLGISLVPYSAYKPDDRKLFIKRSQYGFFNPLTKEAPPTIFHNDDPQLPRGCQRQTIFHEIKHYVDEDCEEDPEDDDLAEYFGRFFPAPIPHLIVNDISNPTEIISRFGTSYTIASHISSNVINRMKKYGKRIFDYEKPLVKQLDPIYYSIFLKDEGSDA